MKKVFLFFVLVVVGFAFGHGLALRKNGKFSAACSPSVAQISENGFRPTLFPIKNLHFTVVIIGKNNGAYLEKTLTSAFCQNYENFQIFYIDDASNDGSFDLARDLIYNSEQFTKIHLVRNERSHGFLANLAGVARGCSDDEILVVVNQGDWFAHEWVLQKLNQYYADPDLWLTYGQSCDYPTFQMGILPPLSQQEKGIRETPLSLDGLKTFYAGLFKKINDSDLMYRGEYFSSASEFAFMLPMLEMAQEHSQCLSDVLYISNRENVAVEDSEAGAFFEKYIRALKAYDRIDGLFVHSGVAE